MQSWGSCPGPLAAWFSLSGQAKASGQPSPPWKTSGCRTKPGKAGDCSDKGREEGLPFQWLALPGPCRVPTGLGHRGARLGAALLSRTPRAKGLLRWSGH